MILQKPIAAVTLFLLLSGTPCILPRARAAQSPQAAAATQGDSADALASLQAAQAQALASGDPAAIATTTSAFLRELLRRRSFVDLALGNTAAAAELYNGALKTSDTAALRMDSASLLLRGGSPSEAIAMLQPALNGELGSVPAAWTLKAMAERAAGKDTDAAASFEHALRLKPDIHVAYALASQLLQLHQEQRANPLFRNILEASGDEPVWHVAIGDAYREARYYEKAVDQFKQALARDPKALHAEFFLGLTYLQMNEWGPNSQSFEHLRRAVELSPHEYVSNFYLGALESTDGTDLASSNRHLEAAAQADPAQPEVWLYLGLNANREHNADLAERDFRKCINLTGADEARNGWQVRRAYFALGRLLISRGKREEGEGLLAKYKKAELAAVAASGEKIASMSGEGSREIAGALPTAAPDGGAAALPKPPLASAPKLSAEQTNQLHQQSVLLDQMLAAAWNDLGTAQARQQQYAPALASFQEAEHFGTPSPALLRNSGAAAFRVGNFAEASRTLDRFFAVTASQPTTDARAALMLGFSQFNSGHFAEAAAAFERAPDATLADDRAAYSWAFSLARTGHAQQANALATRLRGRALPSEILALVCHLYVDDEDYEDSLSCFRAAYAQDPSLRLAHYEAGQALVHLDRPQEAIAELEAERKLSPNEPNVTYAYAYALLQASRKAEAQKLLEQLTAEHPEQPQAQYQLGKLLLDQGRIPEAIAHLEASERIDASPDYVHYQLGSAYRKASRATDAEREFKTFREIKDRKRASSTVAQTP